MPTPFELLVERVRLLDPEAATYLVTTHEGHPASVSRRGDLDSIMLWGDTRQGHYYWENLANQLRTNFKPPQPIPNDGLTPVQRKCKKLWNQSNWVKQHPQQAY